MFSRTYSSLQGQYGFTAPSSWLIQTSSSGPIYRHTKQKHLSSTAQAFPTPQALLHSRAIIRRVKSFPITPQVALFSSQNIIICGTTQQQPQQPQQQQQHQQQQHQQQQQLQYLQHGIFTSNPISFSSSASDSTLLQPLKRTVVLMTGFEKFNAQVYKEAAKAVRAQCSQLEICVFTDEDLSRPERILQVEKALSVADVFIASLIFDYDQIEWLAPRIHSIPLRYCFECALELMSLTKVGTFQLTSKKVTAAAEEHAKSYLQKQEKNQDQEEHNQPHEVEKEWPKRVRLLLEKFGLARREEDKMAGYLQFLKTGPKLLRWLPGKKVRDLRDWLTVYSYWNAGGSNNVTSMLLLIARDRLGLCLHQTTLAARNTTTAPMESTQMESLDGFQHSNEVFYSTVTSATELVIPDVVHIPQIGLCHPKANNLYFDTPKNYIAWYEDYMVQQQKKPSIQANHADEKFQKGKINFTNINTAPRVAILFYRKHIVSKQPYINQLIHYFENNGILPVPIFINGVEAHIVVRDWLTSVHEQKSRARGIKDCPLKENQAVVVDAIVSTIGFPLVGGPAGSMEAGRQADVAKRILKAKNIPYLIAAPLLIQDLASWVRQGIAGLQSVILYALPELDGAIDTIPLGALDGDKIRLIPERINRLVQRLSRWILLQKKKNEEKKVAIVLYGYPPGVGAAGTAALLNVPKSLEIVIKRLKESGYNVGDAHRLEGQKIIDAAKDAESLLTGGFTANVMGRKNNVSFRDIIHEQGNLVPSDRLRNWLGSIDADRISKRWNNSLSSSKNLNVFEEKHLIGGVHYGNLFIALQPPLGVQGDPMRLLFEKDLTPHPTYSAFYKYLEKEFQADAVIHFGMHGTCEWLPGVPLGNTARSWPDILLGNLPNLYIYAQNNPSESALAKRRGYATVISHNIPPYGRADLYGALINLKDLCLAFFEEEHSKSKRILEDIISNVELASLDVDFDTKSLENEDFDYKHASAYVESLLKYLKELECRLFSSGLHVLGEIPEEENFESYLIPYLKTQEVSEESFPVILDAISTEAKFRYKMSQDDISNELKNNISDAFEIKKLLAQNTNEVDNLLRGLNGEFIEATPGGDFLRDGAGVLPTGTNIYSMDPYRMPGPNAFKNGKAIAESILQKYEGSALPETIAIPLWGLDNIKTKGESVGIVLALVGAKPVVDGTGRVVRFELIPVHEIGRPRIDVLCNLSGIFRDSFEHVVHLLDDMFRRAAEAEDESISENYIRKHSLELKNEKALDCAARLFSNPAGDYGSLVNERIQTGNWENENELGDTWKGRNSFAFGRKSRGENHVQTLEKLLSTTGKVVQQIDSVEYGLTDIQEYYANTGALLQSARNSQRQKRLQEGKKEMDSKDDVTATFVESYGKVSSNEGRTVKDLDQLLRLEYRSKLLNPKWAQAMIKSGSGGAFEISTRMSALIGWGGTTGFQDNFVYAQAAERYVLDEEVSQKLKASNPEAFQNVVGRLLEAHGRGLWDDADPQVLNKLRQEYDDIESKLEGVEI